VSRSIRMIKICRKCGLPFVAKFVTDNRHRGKCPVNKKKRPATVKPALIPKPPKVVRTPTEKQHIARCAHYGITPTDYDEMSKKQDNRCAICGAIARLVIDHSHNSLKVRGLLCSSCNTGLGMFRDSISVLRNAADYVEERT
jgi:hypothetical protein